MVQSPGIWRLDTFSWHCFILFLELISDRQALRRRTASFAADGDCPGAKSANFLLVDRHRCQTLSNIFKFDLMVCVINNIRGCPFALIEGVHPVKAFRWHVHFISLFLLPFLLFHATLHLSQFCYQGWLVPWLSASVSSSRFLADSILANLSLTLAGLCVSLTVLSPCFLYCFSVSRRLAFGYPCSRSVGNVCAANLCSVYVFWSCP